MFRMEFSGMSSETEGRAPNVTPALLAALVRLFVKGGQQQQSHPIKSKLVN